MADEERSAEDERGVEGPSVNAFLAMMRTEVDQRRESAQAFSQEQSQRPSVEELAQDQQRQQAQLAEIERSLGRLRRSVLIASLCSATVLVALFAFVGYFFVFLKNEAGFAWDGKPDSGSAIGHHSPSGADAMSDLVFVTDPEFAIRNNVDREYQVVVRQLYLTMRTIREPRQQGIEAKNAATEHYIRFMSDVSRVIDKAAKDRPSEEILIAIVNIAAVGQQMRREVNIKNLSIEMQNKHDQIRSVLRARDARLDNADL